MISVNPFTGQTIKSYQTTPVSSIESIIDATQHAYLRWRKRPLTEKGERLLKIRDVLNARKEELARLMVEEMGKPITQARAEVDKCALVCEFYAQNADTFLRPQKIETDASNSFVSFKPLGIVLAVMPWNFPFWQVFRFLAPALMAGNAALLKHASNVPGCALAISDVLEEAGLDKDLFHSLLIGSKDVAAIIENPAVRAVTLTGSTPAGKSVAQLAGANLKKTVLELGGSDPYVIFEDADLEKAVADCVTARLINNGQSCVAAKRFIVVEKIKTKFEEMFVARMKNHKMGAPMDEGTDIGPMARFDLRDELHEQVMRSVKDGARLLLGGEIPDLGGAFYPPTVLTDVHKGVLAYEEELFGPVAAIIPASDEADAIAKANDSIFGLGAAVFTEDIKKGEHVAENELEAGCCFVNTFVRSDPRLPFGGVKESGYGRELSAFGMREFVNIKTVYSR